MIEEIFKYGIVIALAALVVVIGYKLIASIKEKGCESEIVKFELEFGNLDKYVRHGEKELRSFKVPCNVDRIYILDLNKTISPDLFSEPIIKDSLSTGSTNNVFLVRHGQVLSLFNAGNVDIDNPHYLCFSTSSGNLDFYLEGQARSVKMSSAPEQELCS